ncbi:hypothetical protein ACXNSR_07220 [Streptomyces sp. NC-S4]
MNRYAFLAARSAAADAPKAAVLAGAPAYAPVLAAFDGARS